MTRDEIIALAREAGDDVEHTLPSDLDFLERFARLVAADYMNFNEIAEFVEVAEKVEV